MKLPKCMMNTLCLCLSIVLAAGPAANAATPAPAKKGQARITINLPPPGASLGTVLKMITELSGMPLLTSPEIAKKPVSIYLPNVTGQQALDSVCETQDLFYEFQPETGLYVVKQIASKVFLLERVNASEIKDVVTVLVGDDLGQEVEVDTKNNVLVVRATNRGIKAVQQFIDTVDARPRQNVAYFPLEHVQAKDVKTIVEALVGETGKVEADEKNNVLAVDSSKGNIETIRQLLFEVDVPPRQVLIKATLAELNDDASEELGILWNARVTLKGGARQTRFPFDNKWVGTDTDGVGWTFGEVSFKEFQVQLDAMETNGDAKVLASPRIRALHGEEASINITTKTVVGEETSGETQTALVSTTPIYEDVGVSLKVTPLIHPDGSITLKVAPSVSTAKESSFFKDRVDTFNRTATTTVSVTDGETIAIGGLLQNEETDKITKVPILGDIPVLGKLFTHSSKETRKSDLVVFLTLHIIDQSERMTQEADDTTGSPVFDATDILVKYNTAVTLFNNGKHVAAEPLLKELLTTPLDISRKHTVRQYLAAIDKKQRELGALLSEMGTPPAPEQVTPPPTEVPAPIVPPPPPRTIPPPPVVTPPQANVSDQPIVTPVAVTPLQAEVPSQPVITTLAVTPPPFALPPPPVVTPPQANVSDQPTITPALVATPVPVVSSPAEDAPSPSTQEGSAIPPPGSIDVPTDFHTAAALYQRGDYAQAKLLFQHLKQDQPEADHMHRVEAYLSSIEERTKYMEADLLSTAAVGAGDPLSLAVPSGTGTAPQGNADARGNVPPTPPTGTIDGSVALPADADIHAPGDISQAVAAVTAAATDDSITLAPLPVHEVTLEAPPMLSVPSAPPLSFSPAARRALDSTLAPHPTPTSAAPAKPAPTITAPAVATPAKPARPSGRRLFAVVGSPTRPAPPIASYSRNVGSPVQGTAPLPALQSVKPLVAPAYNEAVWLYQTGKFGEAERALTKLLSDASLALDQRQRIQSYLEIISQLHK